jgi:predicted transposase YbfD/YdcC
LELPNGISSHDTFERMFARLRPEQLQQCFLNWVQAVFNITDGQLINLDGKTLRGSYDRGGKQGMIHMVSAWASQNRLVLGQRKVSEKSNEITAIPELLQILDLNGAVVSIDAMGCQTEIAAQIVAQQGDYVLALKGNQGDLHQDVQQLFDYAHRQNFRDIEHDFYETQEQGHGRQEIRRYWVMGNTEYLIGAEKWAKLTTMGCVESQRQVGDKVTIEMRYYLLSLPLTADAICVGSQRSLGHRESTALDLGCGIPRRPISCNTGLLCGKLSGHSSSRGEFNLSREVCQRRHACQTTEGGVG